MTFEMFNNYFRVQKAATKQIQWTTEISVNAMSN